MIFSIVCFLVSLFVHLGSLFHFYHAPWWLSALIGYYGLLVSFYAMGRILKETTSELSKEEYKKYMLHICPQWMNLTVGFLILYALANTVYYFIFRQSADNDVYNLDAKYQIVFSLWMALHFLIFAMLYGCRYFKKYGYPQIESE